MDGQVADTIKIEGIKVDDTTYKCNITIIDSNGTRIVKGENIELHAGLMGWLITYNLQGKESKVTVCVK